MHQYNQAAHEKNLERQQSLESEMKQARQNLDHMRSMLIGGSGVSKPVQQLEKRHGVGLTLTRKDLPKFQLASSMNPPFPEEEKFDSEEHFLRTFEKVVYSAGMDIEQIWDRCANAAIGKRQDNASLQNSQLNIAYVNQPQWCSQ
ncbi:hypothetical protein G6F70_009545 [Rhizopus microsporus]|nr:hypothetical protein G6F71_009566 [Rhizopus microsporus]KAG1187877.1 hypothetical protein G6F70_009545 [Rhizopus microsporus]KAG1205088.1 hypothetical protein G6F69_009519 [Rhizopus microsporus]